MIVLSQNFCSEGRPFVTHVLWLNGELSEQVKMVTRRLRTLRYQVYIPPFSQTGFYLLAPGEMTARDVCYTSADCSLRLTANSLGFL